MADEHMLLGKNFIPPDIHGKGHRQGQVRGGLPRRGHGVLQAAAEPDAARARAQHRRERGARDARRARDPHGRRRAAQPPPSEPILTNEPMFVGQPILAVAAESETARAGRDRQDQDRSTRSCRSRSIRSQSLFPGGPDARLDGNVVDNADRPAELQEARSGPRGDFARRAGRAAADGRARASSGRTATSSRVRESAKLVLDETFVTAGMSHHSMEPRSRDGVLAERQVLRATARRRARASSCRRSRGSSASSPTNLVYIAEFCGGGFGSKGSRVSDHGVPALHVEEDRQARDDAHQPRRGVLLRLRARRASRAGSRSASRETAASRRPTSTSCRRTARTRASATGRRRGDAVSIALSAARDALPRRAGDDEHAAAQRAARPGPEPDRDRDRAADRQGRAAARDRPRRDPAHQRARRRTAKLGASQAARSRAAICAMRSRRARRSSTGRSSKKRSGQRNGTKVTGIGVGTSVPPGRRSRASTASCGITPDGKVHIHSGVGNLGTYSHTGTSRIAAEVLKANWENCVVERGDTPQGPAVEHRPVRQQHVVHDGAHELRRRDGRGREAQGDRGEGSRRRARRTTTSAARRCSRRPTRPRASRTPRPRSARSSSAASSTATRLPDGHQSDDEGVRRRRSRAPGSIGVAKDNLPITGAARRVRGGLRRDRARHRDRQVRRSSTTSRSPTAAP